MKAPLPVLKIQLVLPLTALLALSSPPLTAENSFGELIFTDDFERTESQEVKDEPGNE